jgi:predicted RNA methylase
MKIELDKYYTPIEKSIELIEFTLNFIGRDKIDTIIEPSAGNGSFSNYLIDKYSNVYKIHAFDIKPEEERIKEQDFLKLHNFRYNDKCLIIGNPPFGVMNSLIHKFYNKSLLLSKYIGFVLPISYFNNVQSTNKSKLIYSIDLNKMKFSNVNLHCCFNIFEKSNIIKTNTNKIDGIDFYRSSNKEYNDIKYDYKICRLGSIGKYRETEQGTDFKIVINHKLKDEIISVLKNYDWKTNSKSVGIPYLTMHQIISVLKEQIPELNNKQSKHFEF